jgi:hypothetical protein
MRSLVNRLRMTLAALIVATATTGCALFSDRVAGCVAPANEAALLDELAKDPVLGVSMPGATRRAEPKRQEACHRIGKDVSRTSVTVEYDLSRNPSPEEIRAAFDPVATKAGWVAMPGAASSPTGVLRYCRDVLDQPILLIVGWEGAKTVDSSGKNERVPAHLGVVVHGSADGGMTDGGMADLKASRQAVGCKV